MQQRNLQSHFGTNSTISSDEETQQNNKKELQPLKQTETFKNRYNQQQNKASTLYYLRSYNNLQSPVNNDVSHQQYKEPKYNSFSPPKTFAFNLSSAKFQQQLQQNLNKKNQFSLKNQRITSERSLKNRENRLKINNEIQQLQMRSSVFNNSFNKTTGAQSNNNPFSVGKKKKKHGFFDQFSNKNFSMTTKTQPTQTSFNSQNPSQLSTSFNHNIQNCLSDSDKKVGLLSNENIVQTGVVKSYNKFDNNMNPYLKNLRDEFYDSEMNFSMPEVQRIRSELYLNSQYQQTQNSNFFRTQNHQVSDIQEALSLNNNKVDKINKLVNIKRYKQPQIGEEEVQKKKLKSKLKNGKEYNRLSMIQEQYESLKQATIEQTISLDVHIRSFQKVEDWHPQGRIGGTLTAINGHLYLIGGRCNELLSDVHMLKIQRAHTLDNTWMSLNLYQKIDFQGDQKLLKSCTQFHRQHQKEIQRSKSKKLSKLQSLQKIARNITHVESDEAFTGRFNHTAVCWKKYIVVFGGEQEFDMRYKKRSVLNEVFFFDSVLLTWSRKICRGDAIESRRNHTSTMLGDNMIVIGGLNSFEKCPKDLVYLDLHELKWKTYGNQGDYKNIFEQTAGLCEHQACAVYEDLPRQKLHSDKYYKPTLYIKEQGIYLYGGKFQNNKINDSLYLLNTFNFPVKWKKIETMGIPPQKRYSHSMHYDSTSRVLIVCGGKTERKDTIYLDDIWILKMQNYQWMKINVVKADKYKPIANFSSCMYQSQIFVFGGMHSQGFYGGTLDIHEYDQKRVRQIKNGHTFEQHEEDELKKIKELQLQQKQNETNVKSFQPIPETLYTNVRQPKQQRKSILDFFKYENKLVD